MEDWQPASKPEVLRILDMEIAELPLDQRRRFNDLRVPLRRIPIARTAPPEFVFVVAEVGERLRFRTLSLVGSRPLVR